MVRHRRHQYGLCMCNSIRIFEEQRREHHLQVLIDDAVAEVILRGYPVGPELHNLYQDVNGTRKEVRQASSPSMTFSEGVPNEDVAHEDNTKKNWSHTKVNTLIHLYKENKASFENNFTRRKDVWQKIAKKLNKEAGTTFSLEEVDKKWRNLKDRYKRIVVKKRQTGREKSKWQYFDLMDQMLQKDPAINPPHIAQARCSDAMETAGATTLTEVSQEQTVFPVPSSSPPPAPPASSKKRMPLTGAERQKRFRERKKAKGNYDQYKAKHAEEVRRSLAKQKESEKLSSPSTQSRLEEKRRQAVKKRVAEHRCRLKEKQQQEKQNTPFQSAVAFAKPTAVAKQTIDAALPSTPRQRKAICRKLYAEFTEERPSTSRKRPKRMPLTGAERQKRFRERKKAKENYDQDKAKHTEEVRNLAKQKQSEKLSSPSTQSRLEEKRRHAVKKRVAAYRRRLKEKQQQEKKNACTPFQSAIAFAMATAMAKRMIDAALPSTPMRRKVICRQLYAECTDERPFTSREMPKRSTTMTDETVKKVKDFYEQDGISRQAPARKDVTTIHQDDGSKAKVQTRHLISSVMETYAMFHEEYPDVKVGKSKFAELRPKQVMLSSKLPHNVCLCKYHENFITVIDALHKAIPEFPAYSRALPETFLCDPALRSCWMNMCNNCKNGVCFASKYHGILQNASAVSWCVWKNDGENKLMKVLEEGTTDELEEYIISILPQFLQHCFIKREQAASYNEQREAAVLASNVFDASKALLQIGFSENFICVAQEEIQSAHWKQNQVSLFTATLWSSGTLHSEVIASDNGEHSKETLIAYVDRLLQDLPDTVEALSIWSDGRSSQIKNHFVMALLPWLEKKHNIQIAWNFFATSHGKGPVDGIGGAAKRHVWGKVKTQKHHVNNAKTFVSAAKDMANVKVFEMTQEDIQERNDNLDLLHIFENAPPIHGISDVHHARVVDDYVVTFSLTKDGKIGDSNDEGIRSVR